ncbi:MAG: arsenic efflux protein [Bacteroidales bacterium]|jgi:hypothetical protein|nr:arsenic efflux protein [Bacteroidales bacterium]
MLKIITDTFIDSVSITGLVMIIMIIIESLNIGTRGFIFNNLKKTRFGQILVSALLGSVPGCMGGFASVSLYTHKMISFGALVAMMIATTGDESFMMIAMFPGKAAILFMILFALAILSGVIVDISVGFRKNIGECDKKLGIEFTPGDKYEIHKETAGRKDRFKHFLKEHLWKHIIKKHLPKIFFWTFGILLIFAVLSHFFDINKWITGNTPLMILLAMAIGLIPESGPHMIFVSLFATGVIPFPVLLANSIVQEGHAGLPLLAESKKSFAYAKLFKCILAGAISYTLMFFS